MGRPERPLSDFGVWLDRQLAKADLNMLGLATKLGLSHSSVHKWMYGTSRPSPRNARRVADVFMVSVAEVYAAMGLVPRDMKLSAQKQEIIDLITLLPEDQKTLRSVRAVLLSALEDEEPEG